MQMIENLSIKKLLRQYYKSFYCDQLGLKDWEQRIETRLDEERHFASSAINCLEEVLQYDFSGKKVLVVGAGTGAEFIALHKKGAEVHALEPNPEAVEILKLKCQDNNISSERVVECFAENIPYPDDEFDMVYCYTVLEHVENIEKTLLEMVRIVKVCGYVFIETPNYRMPYEPHYKIFMPTFLPKILLKAYLWLRRRPRAFIDSINFIHRKQILDIVRHMPVLTLQVLHDYPVSCAKKTNPFYFLTRYLGIEKDFWFILQKQAHRRK